MKKFEITGKLLKAYREHTNISQNKLAKKLKCHVQFVSNAERGLCLLPPKQFKKLGELSQWKNSFVDAICVDNERNVRNKFNNILGVKND